MEYVFLGNSDLRVSRMGFGCCPMGGHGWGRIDPMEMGRAIRTALENGVTLFDTADIYGLGRAEEFLGDHIGTDRERIVIASKFGVRRDNSGGTYFDNNPAWMTKALDASLKRLKTDYIDLYQIHHYDGHTPLEEIMAALEEYRKVGKIRYFGLSNLCFFENRPWPVSPGLVSFQEEFSLARHDREQEIREIMTENGLSFLSWGSLGQGILSGKYDSTSCFPSDDRRNRKEYVNFYGEKLRRNLAVVEKMKQLSECTGHSLPQIAVRWILEKIEGAVVLVGIKTTAQLQENAGAFGWSLGPDKINQLKEVSKRLG